MKALVKVRAERGLWIEEVPEPEVGINDVKIRVLATGICGTDLHIYEWDSWAQKTVPVPLVIGHEFVGEIVEVGSNVSDFHIGDRVSGEGHVVCARGEFEDGLVQTRILGLTHSVSGWGCGLVDLDNDGWLDLFVAAGGLEPSDGMANRIFRNQAGTFTDVSDESGVGAEPPRLHRGCVFADFDRDGRLDLAVTSLDGPIELWWNRSPQAALASGASDRYAQ